MEHDLDVRAIRARLGLTQAQLSEELGVDQSTVSNWENGTSPRGPARKLLQALSERPAAPKAQAEGAPA
jgi:DNA-binding transcriptional regulator YiaG